MTAAVTVLVHSGADLATLRREVGPGVEVWEGRGPRRGELRVDLPDDRAEALEGALELLDLEVELVGDLDELDGCEGHESLRGDRMGADDFCDGTCRDHEWRLLAAATA